MGRNVPVDGLADAIMEGLEEYADLATDTMKKAVRHSAKTVKDEIEAHAPKDTGTYSKSWRASKQTETSTKLEMTVHSANRYQIAHLLEHGHAKRGGGRVDARPHIAAAEEKGIRDLEDRIKEGLSG